ncbi:HAD family hydrolase [Paenibacillus sp. sptzw28]|uniref:HAD family hydrolase n=1 Tax=Paenibacillus sp. sptzw28 TaxID=715179 RepID=UPI001C6F3C67|nr:HAD family hydrolase [Paenibacillus sp. sptzw28]QYR23506.1 HAD family hydrolase [Paenibacillus sp. sptzw28]
MNNETVHEQAKRLHAKAVIFDLDNTLLDRTATFRRFSEKLVDRYFKGLSGQEREARIEYIRVADQDGYKNKPDLFAELSEHKLFAWDPKPAPEELLAFYKREYVKSAQLMETAAELLAYCRKHYKVGLITNGLIEIQYGKIELLSLRTSFDHIAVSEEVGVKKPDRRIYEHSLESLGVNPEEAVYIGDHPVNDIGGAAAVGMQTIWLRRNQPWTESVTAVPLVTVETLRELLDILRGD